MTKYGLMFAGGKTGLVEEKMSLEKARAGAQRLVREVIATEYCIFEWKGNDIGKWVEYTPDFIQVVKMGI